MSNTPPIRQDDLGRSTRTFANLLYPGAANFDFSPHLLGIDQSNPLGAYRANAVDLSGGAQVRCPTFTGEAGTSGRNEARSSSRAVEDEGNGTYRARNDSAKTTRDMNPSLDGDYKGLDSAAALNMAIRSGDYSNGYPSDSSLSRNFQQTNDQRSPFSNISAYGCIQPSHPRISGLQQFLPPTSMIAPNLFTQPAQYDVISSLLQRSPYLDHPIRDVPSYGMDRRTHLSYSAQGHIALGQSGAGLNPYQDYHKVEAERGMYGAYASTSYGSSQLDLSKKAIESGPLLASRLNSRRDSYSLLNNYPRSTSSRPPDSSGKKYSATDTYAHSLALPQNGIKPAEAPVIDLTNSKSPDPRANSLTRTDFVSSRSAPPNARDSKITPKENGSHRQGDALKGWNPSRRTHHYPGASMSPFSSFSGVPPIHPMSLPGHYKSATLESTFNDLTRSKAMDSGLMKSGAAWRHSTRHHTPSPRQYNILDSSKKNGSPSLPFKSKTVSQGAPSDLTFNYPEGSGAKTDKLSQPFTTKHLGNGILSPKSQPWSKKNDSKLSPYENLIMDSARDGKPYTGFGKFDNVSYVQERYQQNHSGPPAHISRARPILPPDYTFPQRKPSPICGPSGNTAEHSRNSVIRSVPKLTSHSDDTEKPPPDKAALPNSVLQSHASSAPSISTTSKSTETKGTKELPSENQQELKEKVEAGESAVPPKPGLKRKSSKIKDGEQRPKRKYTKRSDVWKKKRSQPVENTESHQQQQLQEEKRVVAEQALTCEPSPPPKAAEESDVQTTEPARVEKSARPQRRSGGADMDEEYLYGWFTDEETENDDSSDEDYSCTTKFLKLRSKGVAKTLRQRRRLSSWRFDFGENSRSRGTSRDEEYSDYAESSLQSPHCKEHIRKRQRRKSELRNKADELTLGKPEDLEKDEGENDAPPHSREDDAKLRTDYPPGVLCDESGNLFASKMPEKDKLRSAETEPAVRKKRKYTRRLDDDGKPIKRARKALKSVEHIPMKKSKHSRMSDKHFKRKISDGTLDGNLSDLDVPAALREEEDILTKKRSGSDFALETASSEAADIVAETTGAADVEKFSQKEAGASVQGAVCREDLTATHKIKKKPGRKPGWRKYPQGEGPDSLCDSKAILKKKYKKPKGDGLCRFGMRKRGKRPKLRLHANALLPEATSNIVETTMKSGDISTEQVSPTKPKRKYNMASRLEKKRQRLLGLCLTPENKDTSAAPPGSDKKFKVHKISEELRSQEYEYDFKSIFLRDEDEGQSKGEDGAVIERKTPDKDTEQSRLNTPVQSRSQTPSLGTPIGTSFPSNLKKLCCNSAIGETPLHKAARMCYTENLQYYLESGTNLNQSDNAGYTALHEACVHNHLEVASLLLQYTADVNKYAVDGTRPLHDAVEYDHLEMVRLMLACGADPMLSKFSGRSIPNMIRSERMRKFVEGYLEELKEVEECRTDDKELEWKFPCSAVFDKSHPHHYNSLDFAPDEEELSLEFEMYEDEPIVTYLLRPDEESERTDYCLLDDYMKTIDGRRDEARQSIRVVAMPSDRFRTQIRDSKLQSVQHESSRRKPDLSAEFIELVAVDDNVKKTLGAEMIRMPLFDESSPTEDDEQHATVPCAAQDDKCRLDRSIDESTINEAVDGSAESRFTGDSTLNTVAKSMPLSDNDVSGGEIVAADDGLNSECCAAEKIQELSNCQNGAPSLDSKLADANSNMPKPTDVGEVR